MLRTVTFAALAALVLAPAAHAEGVRVSLTGKSAEQIHTDIVAAARTVCRKATATETFVLDAYSRCTSATVKTALGKLADPQVAQLEGAR
ncbi:MAG TPA: hypothetical protein VFW47_14200, partial [Phenylobacterium sp.]|nr:hypothetical protein [Phenylobacterium sp.]